MPAAIRCSRARILFICRAFVGRHSRQM